jgi:DNA repair exonuclease SbcCD ATPase subunit
MEMPISDVNDLDEVVRELEIEDNDMSPAEAVREMKAEIASLRAELAQTTTALHSYSDALTQLVGWAEDGSPEDGYLYALTEAKKVLKDFRVVGSEVERLRAELEKCSQDRTAELRNEFEGIRSELVQEREGSKRLRAEIETTKRKSFVEGLNEAQRQYYPRVEQLEAAARQQAEEIARLRAPYRNADENDWRLLNEMVGNGGPANFWRAVFKEVRAALACRPQGERSET